MPTTQTISLDDLCYARGFGYENLIHPADDLAQLLDFVSTCCGIEPQLSGIFPSQRLKEETQAVSNLTKSRWKKHLRREHLVVLERISDGVAVVRNLSNLVKAVSLYESSLPRTSADEMIQELPPKIISDAVGFVHGGYRAILFDEAFLLKCRLKKDSTSLPMRFGMCFHQTTFVTCWMKLLPICSPQKQLAEIMRFITKSAIDIFWPEKSGRDCSV